MQHSFTIEQILDEKLKNKDGESRKEVTIRMENAFFKILNKNKGKKIVIVSHGAAIKFLLLKWCNISKNNEIEYNKKEILLYSPGIIKLVFKENRLIELEQIV